MFIRPFKSFPDLQSGTVEDSIAQTVRSDIDLRSRRTGRYCLLDTPADRHKAIRRRQEIDRRWETELDQYRRLRQETADPDTADRIQIAVENHLIVAAQID